MDQEYQGLGPEERLLLSQLFREMGKEERGAPEIEMHDHGGEGAMTSSDHQGMKASSFAPALGLGGARKVKAPGMCAAL